jgi:hypothetical protein
MNQDSVEESLQDAEILKSIIKKTIIGICEKGKLYPNICSHVSRSTLDMEDIVKKVFNYMMADVCPMELTPAINLVDCELGGGFGD